MSWKDEIAQVRRMRKVLEAAMEVAIAGSLEFSVPGVSFWDVVKSNLREIDDRAKQKLGVLLVEQEDDKP